jgi:hypothetical protein
MVVMDCGMVLALLPKTFDENDSSITWWLSIIPAQIKIFYFNHIRKFYFKKSRQFYHRYYLYARLYLFSFLPWNEKTAIKNKLKNLQKKYHAEVIVKNISFKKVITIYGLFSSVVVVFLLSVFVSTLPQKEETNDTPSLHIADFFIDDIRSIFDFILFSNNREKWLLNHLRRYL